MNSFKLLLLLLFLILIINLYQPAHIVKINADNRSKDIILSILNNTDQKVVKYISSINIVSQKKVSVVCNIKDAMGCADLKYSNNHLENADIYISDFGYYSGTCNTFNNTLYHEIGHVVYSVNNGYNSKVNDGADEDFANVYADNYSIDECHTN